MRQSKYHRKTFNPTETQSLTTKYSAIISIEPSKSRVPSSLRPVLRPLCEKLPAGEKFAKQKQLGNVETIGERVSEDFINLERADAALFIIDVCTALNALPV